MSSDTTTYTDEELRNMMVDAVETAQDTAQDFRDVIAGDKDTTVALNDGRKAPTVRKIVVDEATQLMSDTKSYRSEAKTAASNASDSASTASSAADTATQAQQDVSENLATVKTLTSNASGYADQTQSDASEAKRYMSQAQQAADSASDASIGDVGGALVESPTKGAVKRSISNWIGQLESVGRVLDSVSELRKNAPEYDGELLHVSCHTYAGYGGGFFTHDPDDTSSEDDGGSGVVTAEGHRFKRDFQNESKGDILLWGADPSGENGSADAIQRLIDSQISGTVDFPEAGIFLIDKQVSFFKPKDDGTRDTDTPLHMIMRSSMWSHFGYNRDRACIKPASDLDGAMFTGVYMAEGLAFFGPDSSKDGHKYHALEIVGYVNKVLKCSFNMPNDAIRTGAGANIDVHLCHFIGCENCIHTTTDDAIVTTYTVEECLAQYCTHMMNCGGRLWGSRFVSNTWEQCSGEFIIANVIFNNGIVNNWVEGGGGADSDNRIRVLHARNGQQMRQNWTAGNNCHGGNWIWNFDPDDGQFNARMGGVTQDSGDVIVAEATGSATRLGTDGVRQHLDDYKQPTEFVFKSDGSTKGGSDIGIRSERNITIQPKYGQLTLYRYEGDGDKHVTLKYPLTLDKLKSASVSVGYTPNRLGHFEGSTPVVNTNPEAASDASDDEKKKVVYATTTTPFVLKWSGAFDKGNSSGTMKLFDFSDVSSDNSIRVANDHLELHQPILFVQVNDTNIEFDHWEPIDAYSGSWGVYGVCKGFWMKFRDRSSGDQVVPDEFTMLLHSN